MYKTASAKLQRQHYVKAPTRSAFDVLQGGDGNNVISLAFLKAAEKKRREYRLMINHSEREAV